MKATAQIIVWNEKKQESHIEEVSLEKVLQAFKWYDETYPGNNFVPPGKRKPWTENRSYRWAVWYHDRFYPPKVIIGRALGGDKIFWGGNLSGQANAALRELGFRVDPKPISNT